MNFPHEAMTDPFDDTSRLQRVFLHVRRAAHAAGGWLGPILFVGALAIGLIFSMLWLRLHPLKVLHPSASETALVLDPAHKPLPTPLGGITSNAAVDAVPLPQAQAVETSPEPMVQSMPEATPVESSQGTAEITPTEQSDVREPSVERGDRESVAPAEGDSEPRVIARSEPQYPVEALPERAQGNVRLRLSIDAEGGVEEVRILGSSGSSALDTAAVQSVRTWRYKPAMRAGRPAAGNVDVVVDFTLAEQ